MPSDRAPKFTLHDGIAVGELPPGHAEFNQLVVSAYRWLYGRILPLDGISICDLGTDQAAKRLFVASIVYLPVTLGALAFARL